jgi:hypoxanthine phosphoribosyltransferase
MHKDIKKILLSEEQISQKCKELAALIDQDYSQPPLLLGLLKGSVPFLAELAKHVNHDVEFGFMRVSSYSGTVSSTLQIKADYEESLAGKDVLVIEDILDTGKTLKTVTELLFSREAKSVKIMTLLDKKEGRVIDLEADYVGFEIPNEFVVGFGLDFNEKYRNLPYIGVLKDECYQ